MVTERLKKLLKGKTLRELEHDLGINYQNIDRYLKGRSPHADFLDRLAAVYRININWLFTGEGEPYTKPPGVVEEPGPYFTGRRIPVIAIVQANPDGRLEPEALEHEWIEMPDGTVSMRVTDDSMSPIAWPGQHVLCDPEAPIRDGDLAVVKVKYQGLLFKRVHFDKKRNLIILESINPGRQERAHIVERDDVEFQYRVIGVQFA